MHILIADDHPIFRKGLLDILRQGFPDCEFSECEGGEEALKAMRDLTPDVSILDVEMPGMNGLEVCRQARTEEIDTHVVILTMFKEKEIYRKAVLNGATGYVLKDHSADEIVECIRQVLSGKRYLSAFFEGDFDADAETDRQKQHIRDLLDGLTQAEVKTLKLVNQRLTSKEISGLLFVSEKTVENYRSRICKKLGLEPRNNSLLLWAAEHKDILDTLIEF